MSVNKITVAIVDDHTLFREGVRLILEQDAKIEVVLEAEDGFSFLELLKTNTLPDVVLLDLEMPRIDGIETTKKLCESYPEIKIIIVSMYKDDRMIAHLMKIGAHGYLLKDASSDEFFEAIKTVHKTGMYFSERASNAMLNDLRDKRRKPPRVGTNYQLTNREKEVLELIAEGLTTAEIGEKLFLSVRTIEGHRKNLISKLGVRNTAALLIKAVKENLITIN